MKPTRVIPFDTAHIAGADEFHRSTAEQFRQAIGPGVFMSRADALGTGKDPLVITIDVTEHWKQAAE